MLTWGLPLWKIAPLYVVCIIYFCWLTYKWRKDHLANLLILLFMSGLWAFFGKTMVNIMRIVTLLYAFNIAFRYRIFNIPRTSIKNIFIISGVFFIYYFLVSFFLNHDTLTIIFSQLSRYVICFIIYVVFYKMSTSNANFVYNYNTLFLYLFLLQIIITILKIILIGQFEPIVGSISYVGGALGTTVPLLVLLWLSVNTNQNFSKWVWLFMLAMMMVGFASSKRAVWVIVPGTFILYAFLVVKKRIGNTFKVLFAIAPLLFYFGLRLTPSLNPDNKIWGQFDPEYAWNYAMDYSMGQEDSEGDRGEGTGRVGGVKLLVNNYLLNWDAYFDIHNVLGYGNQYIYAAAYENYRNSDYYFGVNHQGALTGVFRIWIAIGTVGMVLIIIFILSFFRTIRYKRLKILLIGVIMFDYIFYSGTIIHEPGLLATYMYIIFLATFQYDSNGRFLAYNKIIGGMQ